MKIFFAENSTFIYAAFMHVMLFFAFENLSMTESDFNEGSKDDILNVTTYENLPFQQKKTEIAEKNPSKINESLNEIQKEVLSYSIEGVDFELDQEIFDGAMDANISFDRDFKEIEKETEKNKESIFKHEQDIKTLSKVYGYIKKRTENLNVEANISNDKEELLRSKNLLLSYENYQKSLYYKILKNWKYPSFADEGWSCDVEVRQSSTGNIMSIKFLDCVDNERYRRAVKITLFKSSPLPLPNHKKIYNEYVNFTFKSR